MRLPAIASITALALALAVAPIGGSRAMTDGEVEKLVALAIAAIVSADGAGGAAVVVRIGGRTLFFNYGFADLAAKRAITPDSLFNLASIRKVFDAALVKWFNIKDKQTQDRMFAAVKQFPEKPFPSVAGIKGMMALYDNPAMRTHKAEEFYDSSFVTELDKSGFLDHPLK